MIGTRLTPDAGDTAWQAHAACRDMDTELFYIDSGAQVRGVARTTCSSCPVRQDCLDFALQIGDRAPDHGIWGGTTPKQRREIRRTRSAA